MQKLISKFLKIRFKQLIQELKNLGIIYSIFSVLAFSFLLYISFLKCSSITGALTIISIIISIIALIHFNRNDLRFLESISPMAWQIHFIEYSIISLPWMILLGLHQQLLFAILLLVSCLILSNCKPINISLKSNVLALNFIPIQLFEWRAGLRKPILFFAIAYALSWILVSMPFISLLLIWIISSIILGCYQHCEPQDILQLTIPINTSFISKKIIPAIKYLSLLVFPQLVIYSIIHTDQWQLPFIEFLLLMIVLSFTIISKYAFYSPNESNSPIKIYLALAHISILIPFLIPLPFVLAIIWFPKAIKKIRSYTHAAN